MVQQMMVLDTVRHSVRLLLKHAVMHRAADIYLHRFRGNRPLVLIDDEKYCWDSRLMHADPITLTSEEIIGQAHFSSPEAVHLELGLARQQAEQQLQHYPAQDKLNKWRYPNDAMHYLWHSHAFGDETIKNWERKLPVSLRTLIKGTDIELIKCYNKAVRSAWHVKEEGFLRIDNLLISASGVALIPSTGHVVPEEYCPYPQFSLVAKIQKTIAVGLNDVLTYAESHAVFHGSHKGEWEGIQAEWEEDHAQAVAAMTSWRQQNMRDYSIAFDSYKYSDGFMYGLHVQGAISQEDYEHNWDANLLSPVVTDLVKRVMGPVWLSGTKSTIITASATLAAYRYTTCSIQVRSLQDAAPITSIPS
ncbi:hypothetical protein EV360DRAFT_89237 [Lentinula raphanica]|nr:hypothetical protein EV360DRAFT_89237 [Lentinula raphanica]